MDEITCKRCGEDYYLDGGHEPTTYCHGCAHELAESLPQLVSEAEARGEQRGRIAELELWISQNWSPYNNSRFRARIAELEAAK